MGLIGRPVIAYQQDGTVRRFPSVKAASMYYKLAAVTIHDLIRSGKAYRGGGPRKAVLTETRRAELEGLTFDEGEPERPTEVLGIAPKSRGPALRWRNMHEAVTQTGIPPMTLYRLVKSGGRYKPQGKGKPGYEERKMYEGWRFRRE